jgi:hypothetical protein
VRGGAGGRRRRRAACLTTHVLSSSLLVFWMHCGISRVLSLKERWCSTLLVALNKHCPWCFCPRLEGGGAPLERLARHSKPEMLRAATRRRLRPPHVQRSCEKGGGQREGTPRGNERARERERRRAATLRMRPCGRGVITLDRVRVHLCLSARGRRRDSNRLEGGVFNTAPCPASLVSHEREKKNADA